MKEAQLVFWDIVTLILSFLSWLSIVVGTVYVA